MPWSARNFTTCSIYNKPTKQNNNIFTKSEDVLNDGLSGGFTPNKWKESRVVFVQERVENCLLIWKKYYDIVYMSYYCRADPIGNVGYPESLGGGIKYIKTVTKRLCALSIVFKEFTKICCLCLYAM